MRVFKVNWTNVCGKQVGSQRAFPLVLMGLSHIDTDITDMHKQNGLQRRWNV